MEQRFGKGDIARTTDGFLVKVVNPILDDDGWWYEIEPVEFEAFHREVKDEQLIEA